MSKKLFSKKLSTKTLGAYLGVLIMFWLLAFPLLAVKIQFLPASTASARPSNTRVEFFARDEWRDSQGRPTLKGHDHGNGGDCNAGSDGDGGGGDGKCQRYEFNLTETNNAATYYTRTGRLIAYKALTGDDMYFTDICTLSKGAFYNGEEDNNDNAREIGESPSNQEKFFDHIDWLANDASGLNASTKRTASQLFEAGSSGFQDFEGGNCGSGSINITPWPARRIIINELDFVESDYNSVDPGQLSPFTLVVYHKGNGGSGIDAVVGYKKIAVGDLSDDGKIQIDVFNGGISPGDYSIGMAVLNRARDNITITQLPNQRGGDDGCTEAIDKSVSTWKHGRGWCGGHIFELAKDAYADAGTTPDDALSWVSARVSSATSVEEPDGADGGEAPGEPAKCETVNTGVMDWVLCGVINAIDNVLVGGDGTGGLLGVVDGLLFIDPARYDNESLYGVWAYFRNLASIVLVLIALVMVIGQAISKE